MDYENLSKTMSYALRHAPWEYELELDEYGWVNTEQLLYSFQEETEWSELDIKDIIYVVENSDKKRFELDYNKIRALYGHSIPQKIIKEPLQPPEILYHGTPRRFLSSIEEMGLMPKGRQYVHMSVDTDMAVQVGKRRDKQPSLLIINSKNAWNEGIKFYKGNEKVWLADFIAPKYIEIR
jgi:putative RNA 2'-phosphotransferase